jgi:uncharacterized membrane protein
MPATDLAHVLTPICHLETKRLTIHRKYNFYKHRLRVFEKKFCENMWGLNEGGNRLQKAA